MAVYKVPQDVEAEDKLIGPFSFRQFVYMMVAIMGIGLAWGLAQVFVPLAILPLPIILLFGTLALPLRKDQPMEVYLTAIISFYLKPRKRIWQPDGIHSLVEITAPKEVEERRTKSLSPGEAERRLSYLANVVDTQGWAVRGVGGAPADSALQPSAYYDAQQATDILDRDSGLAQNIDTMISKSDQQRHTAAINMMHQGPETGQNSFESLPLVPAMAEPARGQSGQVVFNPYPQHMHQTIISPTGPTPRAAPTTQAPPSHEPAPTPATFTISTPAPAPASAPKTGEIAISPDIIELANNNDLSIETIAHEAERIRKKDAHAEDEVFISLR